jgi:hypothetical protein
MSDCASKSVASAGVCRSIHSSFCSKRYKVSHGSQRDSQRISHVTRPVCGAPMNEDWLFYVPPPVFETYFSNARTSRSHAVYNMTTVMSPVAARLSSKKRKTSSITPIQVIDLEEVINLEEIDADLSLQYAKKPVRGCLDRILGVLEI